MNLSNKLPAALIGTAIVMLSQVPAQSALTSRQVENRAKAMAVKINRPNILYPGRWKTEGTGVIIARDDETYYVLTAEHVVREKQSYQVETPDGKIYMVRSSKIDRRKGVDLAVLRFESTENNYEVAKLGHFGKRTGSIYVFGWSKGENTFKLSHLNMVNPRYVDPEVNDYRLLYNANNTEEQTKAGMSGGPVLDNNGHVIGIHIREKPWQGFIGIPTTIIFNKLPSKIRRLMELGDAFAAQISQ
ncbi:MAG: serine protease [Hormoscilla sp.]